MAYKTAYSFPPFSSQNDAAFRGAYYESATDKFPQIQLSLYRRQSALSGAGDFGPIPLYDTRKMVSIRLLPSNSKTVALEPFHPNVHIYQSPFTIQIGFMNRPNSNQFSLKPSNP